MAEYSAVATLSTPGPDITFNDPATSVGFHDPDMCDGLDKIPPGRAVTEERSRTDGGIAYPRLYGPRLVVLGGWCKASTVLAREQFLDQLWDALAQIRSTGGTYTWAASTGTKTLTNVWWDGTGKSLGRYLKKYQFTLMCPDPLILG